MKIKTITIDALWAWAILHAGKRVENRSWSTSHRGKLAIHAGATRKRDAATRKELRAMGIVPPTDEEIEHWRGAIVGVVDLVAVFTAADLRCDLFASEFAAQQAQWISGPQCWVLDHVKALPSPIAMPGKQQIWVADVQLGNFPS